MQDVLTPTPVLRLLPYPEEPLFLTTESNPSFSGSAQVPPLPRSLALPLGLRGRLCPSERLALGGWA